jgi:hypothetical protein
MFSDRGASAGQSRGSTVMQGDYDRDSMDIPVEGTIKRSSLLNEDGTDLTVD